MDSRETEDTHQHLPRARAIHADPEAPHTVECQPLPDIARTPPSQKSPAKWAYERLILYIKNFEELLDADHEVAMGFTGASAGVLRIEGIGYFDPDIVTFYGSDADGTRTQLIQHVSQLNVILRALPKRPEAAEPRRIGFRLAEGLAGEAQS
ncbi:DUF6173 family protein [Tropicimonas sediminicola]|uniref:Uncharacterized protein n=1 Tax=Tropicimonas sediminicola TaxID=1031541 RepID=A0A239C7B3_9RHOB|nr:DUF6173 family protein [Tropicimonas sediminicola]SNS15334.1 hypothetical protein SAMN05421757_10199 [Tropicimonas sediminicola]